MSYEEDEAVQVIVSKEWCVNGVVVEHDHLAYDTGVECSVIYVVMVNGDCEEIGFELGDGDEDLHEEAISLAKRLGVKAVVDGWWDDDQILYDPSGGSK